MKILVTGANGFIGTHVVNEALSLGHEVIAADFSFNNLSPSAKKCELNLFSAEPDIFQKIGAPDVCIHLAWRQGFVHNSKAHMEDLSKHVTFLQNMIDGGLKYLSVMGTMHEIGYWEGKIDEKTPCNPLSQYGIAKNALRESLLLYAKDTACALHWLRAYYITGDEHRSSNIFSKITQAAENGQNKFPFTSGKNKYDFIDVDELAKMIVVASIQRETNGIINVCSGKPISLAEKVENFIREKNYTIKLDYGAFPNRDYDSPIVYGDDSKIRMIMQEKIKNEN